MPPPPRPSPSRRRENTRARLLEAAREVFAERGIRRVTVDELVGAAGFTRGAFYSNFSSIEELFLAVFEDQAGQMLAAVRQAIESVPEGSFSLDSIGVILESLNPFGRQWYLIHTEFVLLALRNEEARAVLADHSRRFRAELVEVIGDVLARLERRATIPLEQVTETSVALYMHSIAQEHLGEQTLGPDELIYSVLPRLVLGLSEPIA
ncbi:MAG TPA: helix-turn-helix domain-containing protein [Nocardioidaceae bacterium]|nr:helix-turn-helix domain-containing protein [Nocardioidaceae bacterium]